MPDNTNDYPKYRPLRVNGVLSTVAIKNRNSNAMKNSSILQRPTGRCIGWDTMAIPLKKAYSRNSLECVASENSGTGQYAAFDDVNNIPVGLETGLWLLYLLKNSDFHAYCALLKQHSENFQSLVDSKNISMPSESDINNLTEDSDISKIRKLYSEKAVFVSAAINANAKSALDTCSNKFTNPPYYKFDDKKRKELFRQYMIAKELFKQEQCYSYLSIQKSIRQLCGELKNNNSHISRDTKTYKFKYEWELQIGQREQERQFSEPVKRWYLETVKSDLNIFRIPHRIEVLYLAQSNDCYLQNTVKLLESLKNMFIKSEVINWILKGDDRYILFSDLQRICQGIIDDLDNVVNMKNIIHAYQCKEDMVDVPKNLNGQWADVQFFLEYLDYNNIYTLYTENEKEFYDIYFKVIKLLQFFSSYTGAFFDYSERDIYYKKYRENLSLSLGASALNKLYADIVDNAKLNINSTLSFENCFTAFLSKRNELNSTAEDDIESSPLNSYYSEIIVGMENALFACMSYIKEHSSRIKDLIEASNKSIPPYLYKNDDKIMLDDMKQFFCSDILTGEYAVKQRLWKNIDDWRTQVRNGKCHKEIVDNQYLKKHNNNTENDSIKVNLRNNLDHVYNLAISILSDAIKIVDCNIDQ